MSIDKRIDSFITHHCTLDPDTWTPYGLLYEAYYVATHRCEDSLSRSEFTAALRTVPGVRGEKRQLPGHKLQTWGCRGLLLDECAPTEGAERAFKVLATIFGSREFTYQDVARLIRLNCFNPQVTAVFTEGGCLKALGARDWLIRVRDRRHAGYVLRPVGGLSAGRWRFERALH